MSILVYIEFAGGQLRKASQEVLTYASHMAAHSGASVEAVFFGEGDGASAGHFGAQKVWQIQGASFQYFDAEVYGKAILKLAQTHGHQTVILSFDLHGKSLAPMISVGLGAGLVAGVTSLPDQSSGFKVQKNVFSGKAIATVAIHTDKKVLAVNPNSIPVEGGKPAASVVSFDAGTFISRIEVVEVKKNEGEIALPEADRVVSAGRGLKGPENWGMVEDLAKALHAATACSRPVSDIGWRPHHEHVGQTGITVRPNLYIAIGISGAIQHLAGVNGSKTIVVINKDAEAPFFKAADYGVVGDAFEVIPQLIEAVKEFNAAHS
jgi:electron transfer flavoprotein alpha subunit